MQVCNSCGESYSFTHNCKAKSKFKRPEFNCCRCQERAYQPLPYNGDPDMPPELLKWFCYDCYIQEYPKYYVFKHETSDILNENSITKVSISKTGKIQKTNDLTLNNMGV